ncbi:MAG: peroxiredoxin [Bacteroidia bacterium]|nr:MAG: peroxiredoxin [Bacteroidia bacterium]
MAIKTGDKAPDFTLPDTDKNQRSLKEFLGKVTVLAFYPGAFTGVCTKEMCSLRDALANFNALNAQIVGISVDSPFANKGFATQNNLSYPLLSDYTRKVSSEYCGLYDDFGGLKGYTAAKRSVFVLDKQGVVRYAWISENPGVEPSYAEVEKAVSGLK